MDNIEKTINLLTFYIKGRMNFLKEDDICESHNLTHKDTEILGVFCDFTNIHGDELIDILVKGYIGK